MSYELQTDKVLAGGLNLLAPGDMGQQSDSLALEDWRVDQGGQLRSRLGMTAPVDSPGGNVHSIGRVEAIPPRRYYGYDTFIARGATALTGGFDGSPLGMVSFQGRMWVMNRSKQVKDDGTNLYAWTPAAPAAAPTYTAGGTGSGALNGDQTYYVTFIDSNGTESNPSPPLVVTGLAANDSVTLTRPSTTDPQIVAWNVYRSGGNGNLPTQNYKLNNASGTTLTQYPGNTEYLDNGEDNTGTGGDDLTDDGVANAGVIMEVDHDPAPSARFAVGPFAGRILAFGTAANPNRMFWTEADQPGYFPGSGAAIGGNWADIGELGEEFIGAAVFAQIVLIIKAKSVWRLIGDPGDPNSLIERLNIDSGGIGLKAWVVAGANVYFQAAEGIYRTSVSATGIISPQLYPLFKGDVVEGVGSLPPAINPDATARAAACMAFVNGRLYFSYCSGTNTVPDKTLVMNEQAETWASDSRGFSALFYEGQGGDVLAAQAGVVYAIEQGTSDNGVSILPVYQSCFRNQGQPTAGKHYSNLTVEHRLNGGTVNAFVIFDDDISTKTLIGTLASGSTRELTVLAIPDFPDGEEPLSIAIRLEGLSPGAPYMEVLTIALQYYFVPLNGVVFDSGNFKLAGGQVCYLENLEMDLENLGGGTVSWEWHSDLPGQEITKTAGANIADVVGVGTFAVQIGVKEARWARLIVRVSSGACRVMGARVQIRPIGLYLAGSGDDFVSATLSAGSPRLKLISAVRVAAQADGAIPLSLLSDIPAPDDGTTLSVVSAQTVPATAERQWFVSKLPSTTRGKLLRLKLSSTATARVFAILLRAKALGESQSAWEWYEVPITPTPDEWQWKDIPIA